MTLGDLIGRLTNEAHAAEALLALGDLSLVIDVGAMAETCGETPVDYTAGAACRFASAADGEDWLALMNAVERSDSPGDAALACMLRWSIARDAAAGQGAARQACGCGGASGGGHEHR
jgi:hypothetical protein